MGFDGPSPDDVRRLLENESPAVMARELLRVRALADLRAWLLIGVAQAAGVKVTIDEVSSGARTLASVHDAAVAGILETRQILSAALGAHADGVPITDLPRQAREIVSQRNAETARANLRDAAIDEAHRVLDEAGVDREDVGGHVMPLWVRVGELVEDIGVLVDERDSARRAGATPSPFVFRREVGDHAIEVRAPTLPDLEAAIAAVAKVP